MTHVYFHPSHTYIVKLPKVVEKIGESISSPLRKQLPGSVLTKDWHCLQIFLQYKSDFLLLMDASNYVYLS